jgi:hypothetical protein
VDTPETGLLSSPMHSAVAVPEAQFTIQ